MGISEPGAEPIDEMQALVELARSRVITSDYETALQILEIVLTVNLFNLDAQNIYVSVNSLLKGRVPHRHRQPRSQLPPR